MISILLIYTLLAGIIMTFYAFVNIREELEASIEVIQEEYEVTDKQIYTVLYVLLFILGWAWLPYKVFNTLVKKIKGIIE